MRDSDNGHQEHYNRGKATSQVNYTPASFSGVSNLTSVTLGNIASLTFMRRKDDEYMKIVHPKIRVNISSFQLGHG